MVPAVDLALRLLAAGAGNLAAYLAAHVLLCLVPAFFIAGAMAALIPKASITRWLGRTAPLHVSYPVAAAAGSLLAVCSCTIVPLFAGIHRKGSGLGPAITFLFFAPAGNIMALAYTGSILGAEFALARFLLCLVFGIGIGLLMALIFWRDDASHDARTDALFAERASIAPAAVGLLFSLVALLIAIGLTAWRGLEDIVEGANRWTWVALGLAAATLLAAALRFTPHAGGLEIGITGRVLAVALALWACGHFARQLPADDWRSWLWEAWRFVKQIFPLLVAGVFVVGIVRQLIQPEWIQALAGRNDLLANATAVVFGVFMYFPTLVEVPVARMFLDLGMHPGPLLAYLMADPELSLQSILMVAAVIGRPKTFAYVGLVAVFSVVAGLVYGAWVDGAGLGRLVLGMAAFLPVLSILLGWLHRRRQAATQAA